MVKYTPNKSEFSKDKKGRARMTMRIEEALKKIQKWNLWDVGDHISDQLQYYNFKNWGEWKKHTIHCVTCLEAHERLIALRYIEPHEEEDIKIVISHLQTGRPTGQPSNYADFLREHYGE